ncbi:hypothetical protein L218DRAFT_1003353 [Marasmius fiardii PR-910]|nr:hypothetical protein L218DRAFT_1003353 [Marasmius fiardii PR-910]
MTGFIATSSEANGESGRGANTSTAGEIIFIAYHPSVHAERQLVASFKPVQLDAGEFAGVTMELEVNRFLPIVIRRYEEESYTFALSDFGGQTVTADSRRTCA